MPRSFRDPEPVGNTRGHEIENLYEFRLAALINAASSLRRGRSRSDLYPPAGRNRGFSRITLKPGERRTIDLPLTADAISMLDIDVKRVVEPGIFEIIVETDSSRTTETLLQVEAASSPQ